MQGLQPPLASYYASKQQNVNVHVQQHVQPPQTQHSLAQHHVQVQSQPQAAAPQQHQFMGSVSPRMGGPLYVGNVGNVSNGAVGAQYGANVAAQGVQGVQAVAGHNQFVVGNSVYATNNGQLQLQQQQQQHLVQQQQQLIYHNH